MSATDSLDKRQLRNVLGTFTTGVTIVTTQCQQGRMHGVTANSFTSVSLDPPLVLWSQALTSRSLEAFKDSDSFAVNILADDQIELSNHFAKSGEDKFATINYELGDSGVPLISGCASQLECTKVAMYPGGDHVIYVGHVRRTSQSGRRPLAFLGGRYMVPYAHDMGPISLQVSSIKPVRNAQIQTVLKHLPAAAAAVGDHTLCLAVWGNHGPTVVHWEPSRNPVSDDLYAGLVVSITTTACGKAFAAFVPPALTESFVREDLRLVRLPGEDEASQRAAFDAEIDATRQRGVALSINSSMTHRVHGVATVAFAVPLVDASGSMVMTLGMVSREERLSSACTGSAARVLAEIGAELSARLGSPVQVESRRV